MKRTAEEIKEYCDAATGGTWRIEPDSRPDVMAVWTDESIGGYFDAGQLIRDFRRYVTESEMFPSINGQMHVAEFAKYMNNMADAKFVVNAHEDLPEVLAIAVDALEMIRDMLGYATECGRSATDDDARELLDRSKWLEG